VAQRVLIALTTQLTEDQFNPDYGIDRFAIFGSDLGIDEQVEVFKLQVKATLLQDSQIVNVPDIQYEIVDYVNRLYDFEIQIEIVGGESYVVTVGGIQI